jgi:hypothetical protein
MISTGCSQSCASAAGLAKKRMKLQATARRFVMGHCLLPRAQMILPSGLRMPVSKTSPKVAANRRLEILEAEKALGVRIKVLGLKCPQHAGGARRNDGAGARDNA